MKFERMLRHFGSPKTPADEGRNEGRFDSAVDSLTRRTVEGWAIDSLARPLEIEIVADGVLLGSMKVGRVPRSDVAAAYPNSPNSLDSGFRATFNLPPGDREVQVFLAAGTQRELIFTKVVRDIDATIIHAVNAPHVPMNWPFPLPAIRAVEGLLGTEMGDLATETSQMEFVEKLLWIAQSEQVSRLPALVQYFRYLRETWAHCQFVDNYFPSRDVGREDADKDVRCKQSSSAEMMAIIHQLYLLHSEGVRGSFAEFGCFKGFSTSKLSFACGLLNIPMLVFDSFEGLPETDGDFYPRGDFAGSLDEVKHNVEQFGNPASVTYHKGFYSESLNRFNMPSLISLFMDVDLMSSAQDMITALDKVESRGTIFSHECRPSHFDQEGWVVPGAENGGNVVLPIVTSFAKRSLPLRGRHITADTGAFWIDGAAARIPFVFPVMNLASRL